MKHFLKIFEEQKNKPLSEQKSFDFTGRLDYHNIEKGDCIIFRGKAIGRVETVTFPDKKNGYRDFVDYLNDNISDIADYSKGVRNIEDIIPMVYDEEEEEWVFDKSVDAPILSAPFIEIYGLDSQRGNYSYASLIEDCGISFIKTSGADDFCQNLSL